MSEYLFNHFIRFSTIVVDCILAFMSILAITSCFCDLVSMSKTFISIISELETCSMLYLVPFGAVIAVLGSILESKNEKMMNYEN